MEDIRRLSAFLASLSPEDVPENIWEAAAKCALDTVGVGIGAARDAQIERVANTLLSFYGKDGLSLWGREETAPMSTAIFLNAMMSHTLELDDVHTASKTHIGTVVIPAIWALAEHIGASGEEFLLSAICGYETASRIGMALGVVSHRNRGWHVTGTAGVFGATAACGKLLGLDEEKMISALGLAGTQASGLWAFLVDGASCKTLNPARAAVNGCTAALLSKAGVSGPEHILTADDGGMLAAMSDEYDPGQVSADLGVVWQIVRLDKKPYPCCRSTHPAIDAAITLREEHGFSHTEIEKILVETYDLGWKQCGVNPGSLSPETPVEAKFSTPYAVACALLRGNVCLNDFTNEAIMNGMSQELLHKVKVVPSDEYSAIYPTHWGCRITVNKKDGKNLVKEVRDASGSVEKPLTSGQLRMKAKELISLTRGENAEDIVDSLSSLRSAAILPRI
jgi:2-methylcitrate dehydratase PrpD